MDATYTTPEGFKLHRPLLMPEARDFTEVLAAERAWDFATMNHRGGIAQPDTPADLPLAPWSQRTVSRFCSVRNLPPRLMAGHLMVTPTEEAMEVLRGDACQFLDRISFEAIYHESNDRVLIVAQASGILASRWVAYVATESVPTMEAAR